MFSGSYTSEGVAGLLAEGGTARRDEAVRIAEMLGGTLDAYYWCYGDTDFMCIMDVPDSAKIAKLALHIGASGTFSGKLTPFDLSGRDGRYLQCRHRRFQTTRSMNQHNLQDSPSSI